MTKRRRESRGESRGGARVRRGDEDKNVRLSRVSTRDGDEDVRGEETVEMGRVENRETVTPRNRETRENRRTGVILPVSYRGERRDQPFFCHGTTSFDLRLLFFSREGARVEEAHAHL